MKPTKKQRDARLKAHYANKRWFYLEAGRGLRACSFHMAGDNMFASNNVYGIPVQALLRALDKCGYLDQWDRTQQILRKVDR